MPIFIKRIHQTIRYYWYTSVMTPDQRKELHRHARRCIVSQSATTTPPVHQVQNVQPFTWRVFLEMAVPVKTPRPVIYVPFIFCAAISMLLIYTVMFLGNNPQLALRLDLVYLTTFFVWIFLRYTNRITMPPLTMQPAT